MEHLGLDPGAPVLCACSGGIDSTALLAALSAASCMEKTSIHAHYVDHGIRPSQEIESELDILQRACRELGVRLTATRVRRGAVHERAAASGTGIENCAREYRYRALLAEALRIGASVVAVGHNADDQAETVLMRLLTGSGVAGSAGMRTRRALAPGITLVRPILGLERIELRDYLSARGIPHAEDSSNGDTRFRRNVIRSVIGPSIAASFPGWKKALRLGAGKARIAGEAIERCAGGLIGRSNGRPALHLHGFLTAPEAVRIEALAIVLGQAGSGHRLSFRSLEALQRSIAAGIPGFKTRGVMARRAGDWLEFVPALDFPPLQGYFITVPGPGSFRSGPVRAKAEWVHAGNVSPWTELRLWSGSFTFPLVVRTRRAGDAIVTESGETRIDALLSGWGLGEELRDLVPLVEDARGIVCVAPGMLARSACGAAKARFRAGAAPNDDAMLRIRIQGVLLPYGQ